MDKNVNDNETRQWVDGLMAELAPPADWRPDVEQAMERLRRETRRVNRQRRIWVGTLASVSAACLVLLMLPSARSVPQQVWDRVAGVGAARFEAGDVLIRPERYREWIWVGGDREQGHGDHESGGAGHDVFRNVYVDPAAYAAYAKTGVFPEGAVIVREVASAGEPRTLEASVKDRRFAGGWGFFDFTAGGGELKVAARASSDDQCWSCHQGRSRVDPVFVEYYPALSVVF